MAEGTGTQAPPTYFANLVSMNITVDEVVLELRRYFQPHRELMLTPRGKTEERIKIPVPTPEQLFAEEPIARVVLTYSAAKTLKQNLENLFPAFDRARKTGEDPWQKPQQ